MKTFLAGAIGISLIAHHAAGGQSWALIGYPLFGFWVGYITREVNDK